MVRCVIRKKIRIERSEDQISHNSKESNLKELRII